MRQRLSTILATLALLSSAAGLKAAGPEPSQQAAGLVTLQGRVLDPMQGGIANARVTATGAGQATGVSAVTDATGGFTLALPAGRYTLDVSAPGFSDVSQSLTVDASAAAPVKVVLPIAGVQEIVDVNAASPASYQSPPITSATKTLTPLRDVPQSVTVVTRELIKTR